MSIIGIIPAAGKGERMQPLGFSKELLPLVDSRAGGEHCIHCGKTNDKHFGNIDGLRYCEFRDPESKHTKFEAGAARPKAVSEYIIERMVLAGATEICMVISPDKTDIVRYYSDHKYKANIFFVVQPEPLGLCDAIFRAAPYTQGHSQVLIGLPDTVWFPEEAFELVEYEDDMNLILFPDEQGQFDGVGTNNLEEVFAVEVKRPYMSSKWSWGALVLCEANFQELHVWWLKGNQQHTMQFGELLNRYIAVGAKIRARFSGQKYMDVGTPEGYQEAQQFLSGRSL